MSRMLQQQMPPVKYSVTRLGGGVTQAGSSYPGGLDLTTPSLALQAGALRDCLNFECSQSGGYARIAGYERVDGKTAPSTATYVVVQVSSFVHVPTVGQTIVQATSSATGTIIAVNNAAGAYYMVVTGVTGAFDYTHNVSVIGGGGTGILAPLLTEGIGPGGSVPYLLTLGLSLSAGGGLLIGMAVTPTVAISALLNAQYLAAAADVYRSLIGAVPGSGAVLGVVAMVFSGADNLYAFRANTGGTAVNIYKTTPAGWALVPFGNSVAFTAGTGPSGADDSYQPPDGTSITQGGVTATVTRVAWSGGVFTPATHSAAGTLVVTNPVGGNFAAGSATLGDGTTVTLSGAQSAITLLPGGHFEFVKCNFSGQLVTRRIYGSDGVNQCFEFDGTTLVPITTGLSPDAPSHITFHKNFLFISQESSMFYCGAGTPFKWGVIDGGGEIATGDTVTGMITLPGSQTTATLAIYMNSNTAFLYGVDPSTFNFVSFNAGTGALPYSVQNLFDTCAFDHLGVVTLKTSLNYGNFLPSTLTKNIQPFILQERNKLVASAVSRDRSQYRVFFNDGYGLWLTMVNQEYLGAGLVVFPNPVSCCDNDNLANGSEATYFGSSDGRGYVYQMDVGTSFDGLAVDAHITLAWDALKSPRILKRFRNASIEIQGTGYAQINFGYQLGYGTPNIGQPGFVPYSSGFAAGPVWDSFVWDNFIWDGQTLLPTDVDVTGTAENIQVTLSSATNYIAPYTVNSVVWAYSQRRGIRV